jgi:NAD(P)-dependent dehydrogenase (short-subunit alcohol dehydrogenase family)
MIDLKGKSALITGAASGIGRATSLAFARAGATPLVLSDINLEGLEKTVADVRALGVEVVGFTADVSDPESAGELARRAIEHCGSLDLLLNIAGTAVMAPLEALDLDDWRRVIAVDLMGPIHLVHAIYPHMAERGSGHIVILASRSGLWADENYNGPYLAAKFGAVGLCEALRVEGFMKGVGVTCVCPGNVKTNIWTATPIKGFRPEVRRLLKMVAATAASPDYIARQIVRAVERERYLLVTPRLEKLHYALRRWFPGLCNRLARPFFRGVALVLGRYRVH